MLLSLNVSNYALIDSVSLELSEGLTVLTGETGAGKSIVIDALSLCLGERVSMESIRDNTKKAFVQALFSMDRPNATLNEILEGFGIDHEDDTLLITREISSQGKSICKVNGVLVNVGALKQIGDQLVDLHGQYDHQKILDQSTHLEFLDSSTDGNLTALKQQLSECYQNMVAKKKELDKVISDSKTLMDNIDEYKRIYKEISDAKLKLNEDTELEEQLNILSNSEKLYEVLDQSYDELYKDESSVLDSLSRASSSVGNAAKIDEKLIPVMESLENAYEIINDAILTIRDYKGRLDFSPEEADYIQERLETINSLKKKYGYSIENVLDYQNELKTKLENIDNYDAVIYDLQKEYEASKKEYDKVAVALSYERRKAGQILADRLNSNLHELAMPNARFEVRVDSDETKRLSTGIDEVSFMFSANLGQEPKPLDKVASGGEISRLMLSLKSVLATYDNIETMIFDEIDTGISGRTAQMVAQKMYDISKISQLIVITHLPQIAAMSDNHYLVSKTERDGSTFVEYQLLDEYKKADELARMLAGIEVTDTTISQAVEMLKQVESYKQKK